MWFAILCGPTCPNNRFIRSITSSFMSFGQTASHSPMLVQLPKVSSLACAAIANTRDPRSGWPCGSIPGWAIFAPMNSDAEALAYSGSRDI
jgi:hypothetical protein